MEGIFLTDRGQIRSHNEDAGGIFFNQKGELLAIIADGMGGHQAGDVASGMATSLLRGKWEELVHGGGPQQVENWLANAIEEVNKEIFEYGKGKEECHGMGTTIVVAICLEDFATIAHIGDSRCYLLNENGFRQVTEDHSLVNELVRVGQITKNDAEHHPRKNVLLKALGTEEQVKPDIRTIEWESGNALLLCSDGLSNKLSGDELKLMLEEELDLTKGGQALVNLANERGGEDNISLALIRHGQALEAGDNEC
ncbi:Stp1/IreP family PP2C-type Ser/Thr phosphatase [Aciduricibacillus chroicocephali]|uniref:Stp1/IreP family PP2C-type Ser/Thr phosphatase n=1 Tax=Aciduricibacillus chroicocephali TaxID=3054939 RepID=A0ABY9L1H1_9BACI|nr:Stp1/IreP family PP2C-type Ser/Thr phosphatase [Bacillaceae bacterium 44XB]